MRETNVCVREGRRQLKKTITKLELVVTLFEGEHKQNKARHVEDEGDKFVLGNGLL